MGKITTAVFEPGSTTANAYGLWQYDYGQTLRIQGLHLPSAVEIHFSLQETGGTSVSRVGVTKDGVTDVIIPDSMLENDGATRNYDMFAFVYLTDDTSGQTEYKIKLQVKSRPKPEVFSGEENSNIFHEAVQAVRKSADKAAESEKQAEGWAHGREDLPERAQDNAEYYAGQTAADAKKTGTDRKEVERLVESVSGIDEQVTKVENLTKQAQTSATNAALSEQAAKASETNAQTAQAGAETAEANAELAEKNVRESEQTVDNAKQLVVQMGQEVLDNKNHVDQTVQAFTLTAQQAHADVNNAGQIQTERVQSTGNTAVESVKTAQDTATQAVETAKAAAVQTVQTEGTTQTGNVTQEGEKQVQAVQAAAQEIVADREQIAQNKAGIEGLKQGKADAIVETTSGENIRIEDSSGSGFEGLRIFGKSTQDGIPTPESPVPIVSVGDKGTIEVGVTGTNLFDVSKIEDTWNGSYGIKNNNGVLTVVLNSSSSSADTNKTLKELCPQLKNNETYVFNAVNSGKSNMIYLNNVKKLWFYNQSMVMTEEMLNSRVYLYISDKINDSGTIRNIQVNKGDTVLPYESYRTPQSITIASPNGLPGIKVDSDGNYTDSNGQQWICDEIDLARGKYVQRIEKVILDGSQNFNTEINANANRRRFGHIVQKRSRSINTVLSTHFKTMEYGYNKPSGNNTISFDSSQNSIMISTDKFASVEEFKNWLNENNVIVVYALETPIEHDLAPEEIAAYKSLHTNYPTTVVSNDESAHMEVSYVADTKNYIASKIETPLQKQITDLQNALINQKISGGGIKVTDSAKVPVVNFAMWGKTEQVKTTGAQLIPTQEKNATTYGVTLSISNDIWHIEGTATGNGGRLILCTDPLELGAGTYTIKHDHLEGVYMSESDSGKALGDKKIILSGKTTIVIGVNVRLGTRYNNDFKVMLCKGEEPLPWEHYSGGFPSPSPDWEQPIEVTDQPITVTIKGGTEQKSITLVPPRPLTKWDKLEKVDGVWQWVYSTEIYTITGNENWTIAGENYHTGTSTNARIDIFDMAKDDGYMECLPYVKYVWNDKDAEGFAVNSSQFHVRLKNTRINISDDATKEEKKVAFEAYLKKRNDSGRPLVLVYESKNVQYIPLPQPVQDKLNALTMYAGTTEITNDGGCNMELTYTVDTQSYVDTKIAEVSKAII